jgi:guanylate kinase
VNDTETTTVGAGPRGIILYGPPASGKDTITAALTELDPRIRLFHRLKVGGGNTAPYRMISREELDQRGAAGDIVWENDAYGNTYAVDRSGLAAELAEGIPVVHVGQPEAVRAVTSVIINARWFTFSLRCSRIGAIRRMARRADVDLDKRIRTWDETRPLEGDGVFDTESASPAGTASSIYTLISESGWTPGGMIAS